MKYVRFIKKYLSYIKGQIIPIDELPEGCDCVAEATEKEYHSWMFFNY